VDENTGVGVRGREMEWWSAFVAGRWNGGDGMVDIVRSGVASVGRGVGTGVGMKEVRLSEPCGLVSGHQHSVAAASNWGRTRGCCRG
jgi:hypothetical protein